MSINNIIDQEASSAVEISIVLNDHDDQTTYNPGDFIVGAVFLTIHRDIRISKIDLQLYGISEVTYEYRDDGFSLSTTKDKDTSTILTQALQLWSPAMVPGCEAKFGVGDAGVEVSQKFRMRVPTETLPLKDGKTTPLPPTTFITYDSMKAAVMYELRVGVMYSELEAAPSTESVGEQKKPEAQDTLAYVNKFAIEHAPILVCGKRLLNPDYGIIHALVQRKPERTFTGTPSRPPLSRAYLEPALVMSIPRSVKNTHHISPKTYLLSNLNPKQFLWDHSDKGSEEFMRNGLGKFYVKTVKTKIIRHTTLTCGIYTDRKYCVFEPKPVDRNMWEFDLAYFQPITKDCPIPKKYKKMYTYFIDMTRQTRKFQVNIGDTPALDLDNIHVHFEVVHEIKLQRSRHSLRSHTIKISHQCNILP